MTEIMDKQECPMCIEKTLTLSEELVDIPHFGPTYIFTMSCTSCKYHKSDIQAAELKEAAKYELEIDSEEDMEIKIVKSCEATLKIPRIATISPGPASEGYFSNVEGILNKVKTVIEQARDSAEDDSEKKKAKNMLKKINRVIWGKEKLKIIIEDPTGNSAILSDKAKVTKLKI